jgi:hypothetical protein
VAASVGLPVAEPSPSQDRSPDVIAEAIVVDGRAVGKKTRFGAGWPASAASACWKLFKPRRTTASRWLMSTRRALPLLGDAGPASAFCTTDDEYPPLKIHVSPLRAYGFPQPHAGEDEAEHERITRSSPARSRPGGRSTPQG